MERDGSRPKSRRKLSRAQIIDILERNVQLYKEEDSFVHYLVELAVYLLEYEYDWAENGGLAPRNSVDNDNNNNGNGNGATPLQQNVTPQPDGGLSLRRLSSRVIESLAQNRRTCPYCGTTIGDLVICPSCRNVTR